VAPLELRVEGARLDEIDLYEAVAVAVDPDGGVWVLVQGEPGTGRTPIAHAHRATVLRVHDDRVESTRSIPGGSQAWLLTAEAGGEVTAGFLAPGEIAEEGEPADPAGKTDLNILTSDPADDRAIRVAREEVVQVGALAVALDGTHVAGRDDSTRIDAIAPDGDVDHLLGFSGFDPDADVQLNTPLGEVRSLVALPDGRVAFVTTDGGENALRLLDGDQVRTIDLTPPDRSREIQSITPAPDGQLLAVAAGPDTHPQIQVIDVDTGEAQVVADLEGVLRHPEGPYGTPGALWSVAAATDGTDLVFLADGYLWRLPEVFG
jgi:dipeptidyl aminopeptidase/acylaminoacyl peptidase